jgi:hypothetical protein
LRALLPAGEDIDKQIGAVLGPDLGSSRSVAVVRVKRPMKYSVPDTAVARRSNSRNRDPSGDQPAVEGSPWE